MENQAGIVRSARHWSIRNIEDDLSSEVKRITISPCVLPFILMLLVASVLGCSDRPDRVQIQGKVLIDGKPLTYGTVRFVPSDARPASAKLDDEGNFILSTFGENDGIVLGVHQVSVNAGEWIGDNERKWHAPPKYFRYQSSGLSQEITEDTEQVEINLTWDGGEPFIERVR